MSFADRDRAIALSEQAIERARKSEDPFVLADVLNAVDVPIRGPRTLPQRLARSAEFESLADGLGDWTLIARAAGLRFLACLADCQGGAAEEALARLREVAPRTGHRTIEWTTLCFGAMQAIAVEDPERALPLCEQAFALGSEIGIAHAAPGYLSQLFEIRRAQEQLGEMADLLAGVAGQYPRAAVDSMRAVALLRADRPEEAEEIARTLCAEGCANVPVDFLGGYTLANLAEVAVALGLDELEPSLTHRLHPYAGERVIPGASVGTVADRGLAGLASLRGDTVSAAAHFEAAASQLETSGAEHGAAESRRAAHRSRGA